MYRTTGKEEVVPLLDIPQSSVGAPIPVVVAGEHDLLIAFYLQNTPADWNGETVRVIGKDSEEEPVCVVHFNCCYAHMFAPSKRGGVFRSSIEFQRSGTIRIV